MVLPFLAAQLKEGKLQCWAEAAAGTMLQLMKKATSSSAAARWPCQKEGQLQRWTQVAANTMMPRQLLRATLTCVSEQRVAVLALRSQVHRHEARPGPAAG